MYVVVPLDITQRYFWRAKKAAYAIPADHRYQWLRHQCKTERTTWMERQREQKRPLGQIIKEVYLERDSTWWQVVSSGSSAVPSSMKSLQDLVKELQGQLKNLNKGGGKGKKGNNIPVIKPNLKPPNAVAPTGKPKIKHELHNGEKLCPDFQYGRCSTKGKKCQKGFHKCGGVLPGNAGRVCCMEGHGGQECRRAVKA